MSPSNPWLYRHLTVPSVRNAVSVLSRSPMYIVSSSSTGCCGSGDLFRHVAVAGVQGTMAMAGEDDEMSARSRVHPGVSPTGIVSRSGNFHALMSGLAAQKNQPLPA